MSDSPQNPKTITNKEIFDSPDAYFPLRLYDFICDDESSQTKLAKKLDVSRQTIAKYLKGENPPSARILVEIANYFNTTPNYLLGYSDIKDSSIVNDVDSFNKLTKLSEESIKQLIYWNEINIYNDNPTFITRAFDQMISSDKCNEFRKSLFILMAYVDRIIDFKAKFHNPELLQKRNININGVDAVISESVREEDIHALKMNINLYIWKATKSLATFLEEIITQETGEDISDI